MQKQVAVDTMRHKAHIGRVYCSQGYFILFIDGIKQVQAATMEAVMLVWRQVTGDTYKY